ncbi:hypothetical protein GDO81_025495 [Engystomops pustulosus]|uniref:NADH dehydrogenase subunit 4 n=1 Tax=Engystomops pustulosus TaxID=76066 RepID=A0AAV6YPK5_ENGPU|nr:hypothetical protein GDO81_025495 [Engystomops pustulosus]
MVWLLFSVPFLLLRGPQGHCEISVLGPLFIFLLCLSRCFLGPSVFWGKSQLYLQRNRNELRCHIFSSSLHVLCCLRLIYFDFYKFVKSSYELVRSLTLCFILGRHIWL